MMEAIFSHIEYTLLDALVIDNQIDIAAQQAAKLKLGGLCVPPYWVKKASREIVNTGVQLTTVIGYPLGYQRTEAKLAEMELAFADGANAIELVINISAFKSKRMNWIKAEIVRFSQQVHAREFMLTVMIDGMNLNEDELETFCKICTDAGADYICTSPAFSPADFSPRDISHLRKILQPSVGIKIWTVAKDTSQIQEFLDAGADKIYVPSIQFLL
jgi:deoxyribose-phosphate aldolase